MWYSNKTNNSRTSDLFPAKHNLIFRGSFYSLHFILFCATLDYAFHFPEKGVNDVVKISHMRQLTAFTVCLWMSSSNTEGTLISYAVSNSDNELLIEYNRYFDFLIGGTQR